MTNRAKNVPKGWDCVCVMCDQSVTRGPRRLIHEHRGQQGGRAINDARRPARGLRGGLLSRWPRAGVVVVTMGGYMHAWLRLPLFRFTFTFLIFLVQDSGWLFRFGFTFQVQVRFRFTWKKAFRFRSTALSFITSRPYTELNARLRHARFGRLRRPNRARLRRARLFLLQKTHKLPWYNFHTN